MTKLGDSFPRCPKAWLAHEGAEMQDMLESYHFFKSTNILPVLGGRDDQDPRFLQAITVIEREALRVSEFLSDLEAGNG